MARRIGLIPADSIPSRGLLLREFLVGRPQQQRDDQQDGEAADDAGEAVDAGHDAGRRRLPLDQRDDEDEGGLGADIADAVRPTWMCMPTQTAPPIMASHHTNDSTSSARQISATMPPSRQPRKRCSDRTATACRVPSPPSATTGRRHHHGDGDGHLDHLRQLEHDPDRQHRTDGDRRARRRAARPAIARPADGASPAPCGGGSRCQSCKRLATMMADSTPIADLEHPVVGDVAACSGLSGPSSSTMIEVMVRKSQASPCGLTCMAITPSMVTPPRNR